jgi:hypothetical protein
VIASVAKKSDVASALIRPSKNDKDPSDPEAQFNLIPIRLKYVACLALDFKS